MAEEEVSSESDISFVWKCGDLCFSMLVQVIQSVWDLRLSGAAEILQMDNCHICGGMIRNNLWDLHHVNMGIGSSLKLGQIWRSGGWIIQSQVISLEEKG